MAARHVGLQLGACALGRVETLASRATTVSESHASASVVLERLHHRLRGDPIHRRPVHEATDRGRCDSWTFAPVWRIDRAKPAVRADPATGRPYELTDAVAAGNTSGIHYAVHRHQGFFANKAATGRIHSKLAETSSASVWARGVHGGLAAARDRWPIRRYGMRDRRVRADGGCGVCAIGRVDNPRAED